MSGCTPTTRTVRDGYGYWWTQGYTITDTEGESGDQFDRWVDEQGKTARAESLADAADMLDSLKPFGPRDVAAWLRSRAWQIANDEPL